MIFKKYIKQQGFSLVEMAIVLVILGFVLGALLLPLRAQREQAAQIQTEYTLENAKQALLGYAQQQGRLPCPATNNGTATFPDDTGNANPLGGTHNITPPSPAVPNCAVQSGFFPAATLGIQPTDAQGFALDAWNNRIRYAVTADNSSGFAAPRVPFTPIDATHPACGGDTAPDFTTTGNMATVGLACLAPDLKISCGQITTPECTPANFLTSNAVAVVYSTGANGALPNANVGADEVANKSATTTFYSRTPTAKGTAQGEFDDVVTWISPFVLYNAMIASGQLH